jgi:hypothetical protein
MRNTQPTVRYGVRSAQYGMEYVVHNDRGGPKREGQTCENRFGVSVSLQLLSDTEHLSFPQTFLQQRIRDNRVLQDRHGLTRW